MVKFTVKSYGRELVKFTRELNTYGFDENGMGEELLFPIRLNDESGGNQETNLATYLIKYKEFEKTNVKIIKVDNKEGFSILVNRIKLSSIKLKFYVIILILTK